MAKKKSGRITLRMDTVVHARLAKTAAELGMDLNGLLNLIIRSGLPFWEMQADMIKDEKTIKILKEWFLYNPARDIEQFATDMLRLRGGLPVLFDDHVWRVLEGEALVPFKLRRDDGKPPVGDEEPGETDIPF